MSTGTAVVHVAGYQVVGTSSGLDPSCTVCTACARYVGDDQDIGYVITFVHGIHDLTMQYCDGCGAPLDPNNTELL